MAADDRTVGILEEIMDALNNKYEETIHIISKTSNIDYKFRTPLQLDPKKNYKVAVKYFSVYNNLQNITSEKNELKIFLKDKIAIGGGWTTLRFPPGAYEVKDINETIQRQLNDKYSIPIGTSDRPHSLIEIQANIPTGRAVLKLKQGTKIDFTHPKSFNSMLGFDSKEYSAAYNVAENSANINLGRSVINIKSDLINSGYISTNYKEMEVKNIIFSIPTFTVPSGHKIIETPTNPEYLPIIKHLLTGIHLRIVDEDDQLYDFMGDKVIIKLHIKQV